MQTFTPNDIPDLFPTNARQTAVELKPGQYASLQDVLNDLLSRLAKLEDAQRKETPKP